MRSNISLTQRMTAEEIGIRTLWALVHGSPLPIFAVDRNAVILVWNPAAERLFGWEEQEVLGRQNPILPEGHGEEFRRLRERAVAGEVYTGTVFPDLYVERDPHPTYVPAHYRLSALRSSPPR